MTEKSVKNCTTSGYWAAKDGYEWTDYTPCLNKQVTQRHSRLNTIILHVFRDHFTRFTHARWLPFMIHHRLFFVYKSICSVAPYCCCCCCYCYYSYCYIGYMYYYCHHFCFYFIYLPISRLVFQKVSQRRTLQAGCRCHLASVEHWRDNAVSYKVTRCTQRAQISAKIGHLVCF